MATDQMSARKIMDTVHSEGRTALTPSECQAICTCYGIPVPKEGVAHSANEAVRLAKTMGYPVIFKILSPDILHKTDAGSDIADFLEAAQV